MKIVTPGRQQKGWAKEFACSGAGNEGGGCGAVLLVEVGDLFQTTSCARDEVDYFVTFKCAACGVLTDIKGAPVRAADLPTRTAWEKRQEGG